MQNRKLGNSGLEVFALGMGCMKEQLAPTIYVIEIF
jgi:aryl-alcohol dehydrogenase-like predicted oxidoreductase